MPIYEYQCDACENRFEKLAKSMSDTEAKCPKCGSKRTRRQLSAFAVGGEAPKSSGASHGGGCGCCSRAGSCPMSE